jgi:hypothetical protein
MIISRLAVFSTIVFLLSSTGYAERRHRVSNPQNRVVQSSSRVLYSPYLFYPIGFRSSREDCLLAARQLGNSHFHYGAAQFSNGTVGYGFCFGARLKSASIPAAPVTEPPPIQSQSSQPPSQNRAARQLSPEKIWTRDSFTTPVTGNEPAFSAAFQKLREKMKESTEAPLDPGAALHYRCLGENRRPEPIFKPFFSTSTGTINRAKLFEPAPGGKELKFGETVLTKDDRLSGYADSKVYKGKQVEYQSLSSLQNAARDSDTSRIPVTLDSDVGSNMKFFRSSSGEPYALLHLTHKFISRPTSGPGEFFRTEREEFCIYSKMPPGAGDARSEMIRLGLMGGN